MRSIVDGSLLISTCRSTDSWTGEGDAAFESENENAHQQPWYKDRHTRYKECGGAVQLAGYGERSWECGCCTDTAGVERGCWDQSKWAIWLVSFMNGKHHVPRGAVQESTRTYEMGIMYLPMIMELEADAFGQTQSLVRGLALMPT
jgi:hypothetical protein